MTLFQKKTGYAATSLMLFLLLSSSLALAEAGMSTEVDKVDLKAIEEASCWILYFVEGSFGALLVAVSGLGALVAAASGMYRTALQALIVALGVVMIEPVGVMFFDYSPTNCGDYVLPAGGTSGGAGKS